MEMNKISSDTQKSMKTRIITAIVMALVVLPCVIFGDWFFVAIVFVIIGVGLYEVLKSTGKKYPLVLKILMYIFTYSFVFWVFFQKDSSVQNQAATYIVETGTFLMYDIRISTMGVGFLIAILFLSSIVSQKTDIQDIFYLFSMSLFLGFAGQSILFLRFCPDALSPDEFNYTSRYSTCLLIFFIACGTMLNDIFAYFTGVLFGKHKMTPVISPKKTWEGFVGGLIFSTILTSTFAFICDGVFSTPVLKGIIDIEHWYYIIIISLILGLASVLGDLMFSSIKRYYNIKDFGNILPGHGGILDRFDSILMTSTLTAILITFIYYNPIFGVIS